MNKNVENYKKIVDEIKAPEELKAKTLEQAKSIKAEKPKKKKLYYFLKYATGIAAVAVVAAVGIGLYNQKDETLDVTKKSKKHGTNIISGEITGIKKFANMDELRDMLEDAIDFQTDTRGMVFEEAAINSADSALVKGAQDEAATQTSDYSRTNNQVDSVDEADIVKTDGNYIYYAGSGVVRIVDAKTLEIVSEIKDIKDGFNARNIFINGKKLIVLGTWYNKNEENNRSTDRLYYWRGDSYTKVIVYDLSNINSPEKVNEYTIEGYYEDARMIDDNIYFISNKTIPYYYYEDIKDLDDEELLPKYYDGDELVTINCTDIYYFEDIYDYSYTLIAGFNLNDDNLNIETFMGWSDEYYVSQNNMYVIQTDWNYYEVGSVDYSYIYKFELEDGFVKVVAKGQVPGYVNDQFSIDEYKGNLRIVTDVATNTSTRRNWSVDYETRLTILNEDLEQIGCIESLVEDERVYSVRFMGNKGYVVTFEQIDPLFTLDLSNPYNPKVMGELEIPGYSSYLHPYDENHIIGIGYNVKDNGYGGYTNGNMKMSMFDVSDLSNPKEIFNVDIGQGYASSEISYDHKALFYKESENLIGFPITWYGYSRWDYDESSRSGYGLALFKIDMDNNRFIEIDDLIGDSYTDNIDRALYIEDTIYTVAWNRIVAYDLNTYEKIAEVEFENYYYDDDEVYFNDTIVY